MNLITAAEGQKRVVTTVRRFSDRVAFRKNFLEISTAADDPEYITELSPEVFKERLRVFLWGLFAAPPTVTSRMSAQAIADWVDLQLRDPATAPAPPERESDTSEAGTGPGTSPKGTGTRGSASPPTTGGSAQTAPASGTKTVAKPAAPASRWTLVDGETFGIATSDPVRRHVIYELSRINRTTPLAATVVARVFLEGLYLDLWVRTCTGKSDSKLHVKVLEIVKVAGTWKDLSRAEKNALDVLHRSAQNPGQVLSPAALGAAAHGAAIPSWEALVAQWDSLLPITRRIFQFVETSAGQTLV